MLPTFEVAGDWLVIDKSYRRGRKVMVGDVVQFDSVVEPGGHVVKRVTGLEGDYVMRDTPGSGNETMLQVSETSCVSQSLLICKGTPRTLLGCGG